MSRHPTASLDYIRKLYAPQDALLAQIDDTLRGTDAHINIGAEEGKLLQMLIKLHNVRTIVEIGTLAGYSAIWMARALPESGHLHTINKDPDHIRLAQRFFAASDVKNRITMLEGDAHEMLKTLTSPAEAGFDMVFIDAEKTGYNDYLDWAEKNIRKGGLIVADNTLLFGDAAKDTAPEGGTTTPAAWRSMRRFNERMANPQRYFTTLIPTQEGLTVAIKLF
jgi:predicted O-methyltransferase YrrM